MSSQRFTGFKMKSSSSSSSTSSATKMQSAYPLPASVRHGAYKPNYGTSVSRKNVTEEEYFDDAPEDKETSKLEYQPASDSDAEESEEEDPLDAFMSGIEVFITLLN